MSYNDVSVFLVCLSIVNPSVVDNVKDKWVPEVKRFGPKVPFLLVGTKKDLKEDPKVSWRSVL